MLTTLSKLLFRIPRHKFHKIDWRFSFRGQPDDFAQRRLRFEFHEAFQFCFRGAQPSRLPFGASRAEHERGCAYKLKSAAVKDASGGTPLAATGTVALPIPNCFRRHLDNFTGRRVWTELNKLPSFSTDGFCAAQIVKARRIRPFQRKKCHKYGKPWLVHSSCFAEAFFEKGANDRAGNSTNKRL